MGFSDDFMALPIQLQCEADYSEVWDVSSAEAYPELKVSAQFQGRKLPDDFVRIGGQSKWVHPTDTPICPVCDRNMAVLAELDSLPRELVKQLPALEAFTFGDMWQLLVFACRDCWQFSASLHKY